MVSGAYIDIINPSLLDFTWSTRMALDEDSGVFGAWLMTYKDKVFIKADTTSKGFLEFTETNKDKFNVRDAQKIDAINSSIQTLANFKYFKNLNINQDAFKFTMYLCDIDGQVLSTIFHEIYHKWQYNVSPILYTINFFVFLLIGYERSTKSKWSIEGDVRIYVDNETLHKAIQSFWTSLYQYLYALNNKEQHEEEFQAKVKELQEKDSNEFRYMKQFVEKFILA